MQNLWRVGDKAGPILLRFGPNFKFVTFGQVENTRQSFQEVSRFSESCFVSREFAVKLRSRRKTVILGSQFKGKETPQILHFQIWLTAEHSLNLLLKAKGPGGHLDCSTQTNTDKYNDSKASFG